MRAETNVRILDQRTRDEQDRPFLPGMGKAWLIPFYDVFTRLSGVRALHERAVELAGIERGQTMADVGCGTGDLSFAVLAAHPDARVTGLDPDIASLRRAARKARRRRVPITLVQGYADRMPSKDASLDHVVSSLALHHVDADSRVAFAYDALRALRPGGKITVMDFGDRAPDTDADTEVDNEADADDADHTTHRHGPLHALRHLPRLVRSPAVQNPAVAGKHGGIVTLLAEAGFSNTREVDHADHRFGRVTFVQAVRP